MAPTVIFYKDANLSGAPITLTTGEYPNLGYTHQFNDMISSMKLTPGTEVTVYADEWYGGSSWVIQYTYLEYIVSNEPYKIIDNVGSGWNDKITSVKVRAVP